MNLSEKDKQIIASQSVNLAQHHVFKSGNAFTPEEFDEEIKKVSRRYEEILLRRIEEILRPDETIPMEDVDVPDLSEEQPKKQLRITM